MMDKHIPTQLQLRQRDRELLKRIKSLIGDSSMSAAASFVFDRVGEQIVAWLSEGIQEPITHQSPTNQTPTTTNHPPTTTNAIDDLDVLLRN